MRHNLAEHKCADGWTLDRDGITPLETVIETWQCRECGKTFEHPENLGKPDVPGECSPDDLKKHRKKMIEKQDAYQIEAYRNASQNGEKPRKKGAFSRDACRASEGRQ